MNVHLVYIIINKIVYYSNKNMSYKQRNIKIITILKEYKGSNVKFLYYKIIEILNNEEKATECNNVIKLQKLFNLITNNLY